jgi:hypothetical protein
MEFKQHTPGCMGGFEALCADVWGAIRRADSLGDIPAWHEVDEAQRQSVMTSVRHALAQAGSAKVRLTVAVTDPDCVIRAADCTIEVG